jgi:hypothetical protein
MTGTSERIARMTVNTDANPRGTRSFRSAHAASDFARDGFVENQRDGQVFNAPDADVLLDDGFVAAYCFRLAKAGSSRPHQIGLAFSAAKHRRNRVDIDGTLWIDTLARALRDIEFQYVGLDRRIEEFHPGGSIGFREMPNGVVLIDRWRLRLIGAAPGSSRSAMNGPGSIELLAQESGGEVARGRWPDGLAWTASLGAVELHAETQSGEPVAGVSVRLPNTDYRATSDANGDARIRDLVPGPYALHVEDRRLTPLGLTVETAVRFTAIRDSTIRRRFIVPTAEDYAIKRCLADHGLSRADSTWIIGRALSQGNDPIADVHISLEAQAAPNEWRPIGDEYTTKEDGVFSFCSGELVRGARVRLRLTRGNEPPVVIDQTLDRALTIVRAALPPLSH